MDYVKGKENVVANALSRISCSTENMEKFSLINETGDSDEVIQEFIEQENHTTTVHSANEVPLLGFLYADKPLNYYKHQMIIKVSKASPSTFMYKRKSF